LESREILVELISPIQRRRLSIQAELTTHTYEKGRVVTRRRNLLLSPSPVRHFMEMELLAGTTAQGTKSERYWLTRPLRLKDRRPNLHLLSHEPWLATSGE